MLMKYSLSKELMLLILLTFDSIFLRLCEYNIIIGKLPFNLNYNNVKLTNIAYKYYTIFR